MGNLGFELLTVTREQYFCLLWIMWGSLMIMVCLKFKYKSRKEEDKLPIIKKTYSSRIECITSKTI